MSSINSLDQLYQTVKTQLGEDSKQRIKLLEKMIPESFVRFDRYFNQAAPSREELLKQYEQAKEASEREWVLQKLGEQAFQEFAGEFAVEFAQFVQMHIPRNVSKKLDSASSVEDSVHFWQNLVTLWKRKPPLIPLKIKAEDWVDLLDDLMIYEQLRTLISDPHLSDEEYLKQYQKIVRERLEAHQSLYIPRGYAGGSTSSGGHALPCRLVLKGPKIYAHFLNKGEGSEFHPVILRKSTHFKRSLHYFPIAIEKEIFFGEAGASVMLRDRQIFKKNDYAPSVTGREVYAMYEVIGQVQQFEGSVIPVKTQNGQNCADQSVHMLIMDALLQKKYPVKLIKRVFCNARLTSLALMHHQSKNLTLTSLQKDHILSAIQAWMVQLDKFHPEVIDSKEFVLAHALASCLKKKMRQWECKTLPLTVSTQCMLNILHSKELLEKSSTQAFHGESPGVFLDLDPERADWIFDLDLIVDELLHKRTDPLHSASSWAHWVIEALPFPTAHWDLWDEILDHKISATIKNLRTLFDAVHPSSRFYLSPVIWHVEPPTLILAMHKIYAIIDKLARRLPYCQLEDFHTPFFLGDGKLLQNPHLFFKTRQQKDDFHKIKAYFGEGAQSDKSSFYFSEIIDISEGLRQFGSNFPHRNTAHQYLSFLKKFVREEDLKLNAARLYPQMWKNEEGQFLPKEISYLYEMAFFTWILVQRIQNSFRVYEEPASQDDEMDRGLFRPAYFCERTPILMAIELHHFLSHQGELVVNHLLAQKGMSHNQSFCLDLPDHTPTFKLETYQSFSKILAFPTLAYSSLLLWLENHYLQLAQSDVADVFEFLLLSQGQIEKAISQNPALIGQTRKTFKKVYRILKSDPNFFLSLLHLLKINYFIETHFENANLDYLIEVTEDLLSKAVEEIQQASVRLVWLMLQRKRPKMPQIAVQILKHHYWLRRFEKDRLLKWAPVLEASFTYLQWRSYIQEVLKNKPLLSEIMVELLPATLVTKSTLSQPWGGVFPCFQNGSWKVNLETGQLLYDQNSIVELPLSSSGFDGLSKKMKAFLGSKGPYLKENLDEWVNVAGTIRILPDQVLKRYKIFHKLHPPEGPAWFCYTTEESLKELLHFFQGFLWVSEDAAKSSYITNSQTGHFCGVVQSSEEPGFYSIQKTKPCGRPLPIKWIDTSEDPRRPLCFYHEELKRIESMHFFKQRLNFIGKTFPSGYKLECQEVASFYLNGVGIVPELENTPECVQIENDYGERKVVYFGNNFRFIFEYDEVLKLFKHPSALANAWMMQFFFHERKFEQALRYLQRTQSFELIPEKTEILKSLWRQSDHSPASQAFLLHVYRHLWQEFQQFPQGVGDAKERVAEMENLHQILMSAYTAYLHSMHDEQKNHIPAFLRFSFEEEKAILNLLKIEIPSKWDYLKKSISQLLHLRLKEAFAQLDLALKDSWCGTWEYRKALLESPKGRVAYTIMPYRLSSALDRLDQELDPLHSKINQLPSFFEPFLLLDCSQSSENAPHFIRGQMTIQAFIDLYTLAVQPHLQRTHALDLDFLFLLRSVKNRVSDLFNLRILEFVRQHPDLFHDLKFDRQQEHQRVYHGILQRVERLMLNFANVVREVAKHRQKLQHAAAIRGDLDLAMPPRLQSVSWKFVIEDAKKYQGLVGSLGSLAQEFLNQQGISTSASTDPSPFFSRPFKPRTPMEEKIYQGLEKGYRTHAKAEVSFYTLKNVDLLGELKTRLKEVLSDTAKEIRLWEKLIVKTANETSHHYLSKLPSKLLLEETVLDLRYRSGQRKKITIEGLLTQALLDKNLGELQKANPSLKPELLRKLVLWTLTYYELKMKSIQALQAYKKLISIPQSTIGAETAINELGTILNWKIDFDLLEHPEILILMARMQLLIRPEQKQILFWNIDKLFADPAKPAKLLFSFEAGGGKTSFVLPILIAKALQKNHLVFVYVPSTLYKIQRENLKQFLLNYNYEAAVLEVGLNAPMDASHFKKMYENLVQNHLQKKPVILVPETFYALHLKYKKALLEKDVESVRWLSQIFRLKEIHGIDFLDEIRITASPLTQAKLGLKSAQSLPLSYQVLLVDCYKFLVRDGSCLKLTDGRFLKDVVDFTSGIQAEMTSQESQEVLGILASQMLTHPLLKHATLNSAEIKQFWLNFTLSDPPSLINLTKLDREKADLIYLMRGLILVMRNCFEVVSEMEHQRSSRGKEDLDVPCFRKDPTLAYFEDPYMAMALSIQGTLTRGLQPDQMEKLHSRLRESHLKEMEKGDAFTTSAVVSLREWLDLKNSDEAFALLHSLEEFKKGVEGRNRDLKIVFWYLLEVILPQVKVSPQQFLSTPCDLLNSSPKTVLFSAYPGQPEMYPIHPAASNDAVQEDWAFAAKVVHQLTNASNQHIVTVSFKTPEEFFHHLYAKDVQIFEKTEALIDVGGALKQFDSCQIAQAAAEFIEEKKLDYHGIVYFKPKIKVNDPQEIILRLLQKTTDQEEVGTDLVEMMKRVNLHPQKSKLLLIFDPLNTTGANLPLKEESEGLLLIGEKLVLGDLIQATMRLRKFLSRQKVHWIVPASLLGKLETQNGHPLTPVAIVDWSIGNEGKKFERETLKRAYQEIDYLAEKPLWDEIKKEVDQPIKQLDLFNKYAKALVIEATFLPSLRFGGKNNATDPYLVLKQYAQQAYERYQYRSPYGKAKDYHQKTEQVIRETISSVGHLAQQDPGLGLQQTHQFHFQMQETHAMQMQLNFADRQPAPYQPLLEGCRLDSPSFLKELLEYCPSARQIWNSSGFTETFYYSPNALQTLQTSQISDDQPWRKPIDYALLVQENDQLSVIALCNEEAAYFKQQLQGITLNLAVDRQAALISYKGWLIQNGSKSLKFSPFQREQLTQHQTYQDLLTDLALVNGQISQGTRLSERLKSWDNFNNVKKQIMMYNIDSDLINIIKLNKIT